MDVRGGSWWSGLFRRPAGFFLILTVTFLIAAVVTVTDRPRGVAELLGPWGSSPGLAVSIVGGLLLGLIFSVVCAICIVIRIGTIMGFLIGGWTGSAIGAGIMSGSAAEVAFGSTMLVGVAGGAALLRSVVNTVIDSFIEPDAAEPPDEPARGEDVGVTAEEANRRRQWDHDWAFRFCRAALIRSALYSTIVLLVSGLEPRSSYSMSVLAGMTVFAFGDGLIRRLGGLPAEVLPSAAGALMRRIRSRTATGCPARAAAARVRRCGRAGIRHGRVLCS